MTVPVLIVVVLPGIEIVWLAGTLNVPVASVVIATSKKEVRSGSMTVPPAWSEASFDWSLGPRPNWLARES